MLEIRDCVVEIAANGRQALEMVEAAAYDRIARCPKWKASKP
jgi:hypothetical protein